MTTQRPLLAILVAAALVAAAGASAAVAARPVTVSPGSPDRLLEVAGACPTFSWVADPAAGAYELRVYRVAEGGDGAAIPADAPAADEGGSAEAELALRLRLPRGATSWTPPTSECLEPGGRYAWVVGSGGEGGRWSEARMFRVAPPARSELERAVERVLARFVDEGRLAPEGLIAVRALGDPEGAPVVPAAAGEDAPTASAAAGPQPRATTTGESAFMADLPITSGAVTFGVKGVSHSIEGDSAGLLGYSDADSGKTYGVLGVTDSPGGRAVEGWASSPVGTTYGVSGIASSTAGSGVRGSATGAWGFGGLFQNTGGIGLKARGGGGAADLELSGSGTIFVGSSLFRLDFGAGEVFSVSSAGDVTAARFIGDGLDVDTVDGFHASATALANTLLALDGNAKLPASVTGTADGMTLEQITPTTAKGDLLVETGAGVARLPVGADGHVLVADSAEPTGLRWAGPELDVSKECASINGDGTYTYDVTVTNTGAVTLTNCVLIEPSATCTPLSNPGPLGPGQQATATCTSAEPTNTVEVVCEVVGATFPDGSPKTTSSEGTGHCIELIELDKQVSCDAGQNWFDVGYFDSVIEGCVGWFDPADLGVLVRYRANSPGALTGCVLTDSNPAVLPGPVAISDLAAGFDDVIHETGLLECNTQLLAGEPNTGTLDCTSATGTSVSDSDTAAVLDCLEPALEVVKECVGASGPFAYEVTVTNTGTATLANCVISDPSATCSPASVGPLAPFDVDSFSCASPDESNTATVTCDIAGAFHPDGTPKTVTSGAFAECPH